MHIHMTRMNFLQKVSMHLCSSHSSLCVSENPGFYIKNKLPNAKIILCVMSCYYNYIYRPLPLFKIRYYSASSYSLIYLLSKNTAIHMSFLTHMAVFSSVCQPSYLESFFIPAGCLG